MKPCLPVILAIAVVCCAGTPAAAQTMGSDWAAGHSPWPSASGDASATPPIAWGSPRPSPWSSPLPYGYLWQDYSPADKHHPQAPRGHVHIQHARPLQGTLLALRGWLEKLTTGPCRLAEACCFGPKNCAPPGDTSCYPQPTPAAGLPLDPLTEVLPLPPRADLEPAVVPDTPPGSTIVSDAPAPLPPAAPDESRLLRVPVIELAPDFVLPAEPAKPAAPRNRIPAAGTVAPRNTIPAQ